MEKDIRHLTLRKDGQWAGNFNVSPSEAQVINDHIQIGMDTNDMNKAEFIRQCIKSGVLEPRAQRENGHALDIVDSLSNKDISESARKKIRMALAGCKISTSTVFTGELSLRYKGRYSDEQS